WNIGSLASGDSCVLTFVTKVSKTGTIVNVADVSGNEHDYNPDNNRASKSISVPKAADLVVNKVVNNSSPNYGDLVKWTVTVKNNGPDVVYNVILTDMLPSGLIIKSYTGNLINGKWIIESLNVGHSKTFEIVTLVNKTGSFVNNVSVVGDQYDYDLSNNNDSEVIGVANAADLIVLKSVNNSSPNYGDLVKWTITVRNDGPDAASGVRVSDVLPAGLLYQSYVASVGSFADGVWSVGRLANGASETISIVTKVGKTGTIVNVADVSGNEHDHNPANNRASKSIVVHNAADLEMKKVVNNSAPNYNDLVKWTLTVTNNGPDVATNVVVDDVMPAGLVIVSSPNSYSSGKWTVGTLNVGRSASIEIVTLVNVTGSIRNSASVKGDEYDHDPSNNDADSLINVAKAVDLVVLKSVNNSSPNYNDLVKWTITVRNDGPDAASGVRVSDVLPAGLLYQSYVASVGSFADGVWAVGRLTNGASETLTIVTGVNKTGAIDNIVNVIGNEYDYKPGNNRASKSIVVPAAADLVVNKVVNNSSPNYGDLVKWTITVKNNGPDVAYNVVLTDVLPSGLIIKSYTGNLINGKWIIESLNVDHSKTFEIVTLVNKTGSFVNNVSAVCDQYDHDLSNNNDSEVIDVAKAADLVVLKSVNNSSPNYNDLVKWTVTVRNDGPDAATNVVVGDVLPEGLVYRSYVASVGSFADGVWAVGSLANGASETLTVVTGVNKTGSIDNVVNVTGSEYDHNPGNNRASKSIVVPAAADLVVSKSVNNSAPNYGDLVKWTLTVTNNGPDIATNVVVDDVMPAGLVIVSSPNSYSSGKWTVGTLNVGSSASIEIVTRVNVTGSIRNSASVKGDEYDHNPSNNNASEIIDVAKAADLEVSKAVNVSAPNYHDLVKWTITVRNNGPDNASGVFVNDVLPEGLIIKSADGNYSNGKWYVGSLNAFSSKTLEIITFVNKTGLLTNKVNVSCDEYDYDESNNDASSSITVPNSADLEIVKLVNNQNPNYADEMKWVIIVNNNGPDKASNVKVNEVLSEAFELISATPNKGHYINDIWFIGDLDAGERVTLEILTKVIKTGNFTNVVNVTGDEYDYDSSNNDANKSFAVNPSADLEISKMVNNTSPNYNDLVKWTITVRNNGPDKANEIDILDMLPDGLEFVSYNASKGFYSDGQWKFCCLEVGEVQNLEITTRVKAVGEIKNIATATAKEYDFNPNNNMGESSVNVDLSSDLQITKLVNQSEFNYKDLVKWTLIVRNNGPSDATRVVVMDSLPEGLTFISAQGDGSYSSTGTWYVGNLDSQKTKELTIICSVDKTGEFTNAATVKGDQYDYNPDNNRDEKSITVKPAADLSITKTVSKAQYEVGDLITYSIEITNNGPDTAKNINVNEIMDASLEFKSAFAASGDYDDVNHSWHIKSLANGEKTSLNINAIATKDGLFSNMVSAGADTFDHDLTNNYVECVVEIIKNLIAPDNSFVPSIYSNLKDNEIVQDTLNNVAMAGIEMKETGIPMGLLIVISLISLALCGSNISKKR
ncbi:hypothetical protein, partial [Methanobrevibacter sp.]|uniref:hypothetical protein n=1 Tax=Methanobrevibacter sp. TaxID=66852 RepID=UPI00388F6E97